MKNIITNTILLIVFTFSNNANAQSAKKSEKDKKKIEAVIAVYQKALANSDATTASSLYTKTAKFMPSGGPSAIGTDAIKGSYTYVFSLITPTIEFTIDEVVFIGNYAYVTSTSEGTSLIKANNQNVPEINRELFVFEKENGIWKIARYMFNKMTN
jgi:uncharacterized protein (TIGR02246 family)